MHVIELSQVLTCWKLREACADVFETSSLMDTGVRMREMSLNPNNIALAGFATGEHYRGRPVIFGYARRGPPLEIFVSALNQFDISDAEQDFRAELAELASRRWGKNSLVPMRPVLEWSR